MDNENIKNEGLDEVTETAAEAVADPVAETPAEAATKPEFQGTPANVTAPRAQDYQSVATANQKKSIFKKWWFWVAVGVVALIGVIAIASGGSSGSGSGSSGGSYVPYVSPYVSMVKNATNSTYGIEYGDAFNRFFSSPKWSHFTSTEGLEVVEFEGGFYYDNAPATAKFQFVVDVSGGSFSVYHLSINGVSQNKLMMAAFVKKVFESYY